VLRRACAEAATWPEHIRLAVNVSVVQLRNPGVREAVLAAPSESGLDSDRLELEITESVLLDAGAAAEATLKSTQAIGVRIALDDFGSGYCSLAYLRRFNFDKIKIDRSFTKDILNVDPYSRVVMRAAVRLGNSLGVSTTAEGVETRDQLLLLRAKGCTDAQGYLFSKPKSASEIRDLLNFDGKKDSNRS
jgi:EAL domain-containing protein (putative c-di-GMP-specific phosphodiesterase class I)